MMRRGTRHTPPIAAAAICIAALPFAARAAEEESGGLPQLDFATWPTQLFWLAVSFTLAYMLMWKVVTPRIASVLEERRGRIRDDMHGAKKAGEEAREVLRSLEAELDKARESAAATARKASADAMAKTDADNAAAAEKLNAKIADAEAAIAKARKDALQELDGVATGLAGEVAVALAGVRVSGSDAAAAVKKAAARMDMKGMA